MPGADKGRAGPPARGNRLDTQHNTATNGRIIVADAAGGVALDPTDPGRRERARARVASERRRRAVVDELVALTGACRCSRCRPGPLRPADPLLAEHVAGGHQPGALDDCPGCQYVRPLLDLVAAQLEAILGAGRRRDRGGAA